MEYEFTGMRPGEKLFEELLKEDEIHEQQVYPNIYIGKTANLYLEEIDEIILSYNTLDKEALRETLLNLANNKVKVKAQPIMSVSG